ncbi:MAG: hypothetical protein ABH839_01590 [Chloroflexota bacterium]
MDKQNERYQKSTVLYDAGGWFIIGAFFGVALVGVVLDYFWNYLIFYATLRWKRVSITTKKKHVYCVVVTALGLLIDWLYYELTWGFLVLGSLRVPPAFPRAGVQPCLEFITILIPMVILGAVNFCVSRLYLRVNSKQAAALGVMMGIFTAPWLIVVFVLYLN